MRAISHEITKISTLDMNLKVTNLRLQLHLSGSQWVKWSSSVMSLCGCVGVIVLVTPVRHVLITNSQDACIECDKARITVYYMEVLHAGTHFTKDFSITIQIQWKFHLDATQLLVIISQHNIAHAMTAELSCHVQNSVAIASLEFGWQQNEISITFELWRKNCWWNGPHWRYIHLAANVFFVHFIF